MRLCKICDEPVWTGFIVGDDYYCSEEHLHKDFTEEQYLAMYSDNDDHAYYSEWETQSCDDCGKEVSEQDICIYSEGLLGSEPKKTYCCKQCHDAAVESFMKKIRS